MDDPSQLYKVTLLNGDHFTRAYLQPDFGGRRGWANLFQSTLQGDLPSDPITGLPGTGCNLPRSPALVDQRRWPGWAVRCLAGTSLRGNDFNPAGGPRWYAGLLEGRHDLEL